MNGGFNINYNKDDPGLAEKNSDPFTAKFIHKTIFPHLSQTSFHDGQAMDTIHS